MTIAFYSETCPPFHGLAWGASSYTFVRVGRLDLIRETSQDTDKGNTEAIDVEVKRVDRNGSDNTLGWHMILMLGKIAAGLWVLKTPKGRQIAGQHGELLVVLDVVAWCACRG